MVTSSSLTQLRRNRFREYRYLIVTLYQQCIDFRFHIFICYIRKALSNHSIRIPDTIHREKLNPRTCWTKFHRTHVIFPRVTFKFQSRRIKKKLGARKNFEQNFGIFGKSRLRVTTKDRQDGSIESRMHHARRKKARYSAWKQRIEKYPRARRNIPWFVSRPGLDSSPEGWYRGENLPSSLLDLRRFMENSRPLVSPTVRKQSAYDASIVELSMEIPSKLLSNFVHATLSPPLPLLASIYAYAPIRWWRYRFRRGVIDHLFTAG